MNARCETQLTSATAVAELPPEQQEAAAEPLPANATEGKQRLAVLRVLLEIPVTNAPFQALSVPLARQQRITLCTYFRAASPVPPEIRLFEGDGTLWGFVRVLRQALQSDRYDVIHAHTPHVAVVILALTLFQFRLWKTTVFSVHNCYQNQKLRNRLLMIPVFVWFGRIICCGESTRDSFPGWFRWLAGKRLRVVVNGVDVRRVEAARQRWGSATPPSPFVVVAVGRLVPIKNLSTVIRAVANLGGQDWRLRVVGDGPLRASLQEQCRQEGLENSVEFTGMLPRDEVYPQLFSSDVYVSTSWGEGLPVAVLEAMACGCPVILSDIAPHREIARDADFIPLVSPEDTAGFTREIARLRDLSPAERRELGERCAQWVRTYFSLESMHRGYEAVFREVSRSPQEAARHAS